MSTALERKVDRLLEMLEGRTVRPLWDIKEVARYFGVSPSSARDIVQQPKFPRQVNTGVRICLWPSEEVEEFARISRVKN